MPFNQQKTDFRVADGKTTMNGLRFGYVSASGLFGINQDTFSGSSFTPPLNLGWTVTHLPTGRSLAKALETKRAAELVAAVWESLPINWNRKTAGSIVKQAAALPPQLRARVALWSHKT